MDGHRLKELRLKRGHTLESLSEMIDINGQQIWRWEANRNEPSAEMVAALARALDTSSDYLLGLTDDPAPRDSGLKPSEQRVVSAMRRGDLVEAMRAILTSDDELAKT